MATVVKDRKPKTQLGVNRARDEFGGWINRVAGGGERLVITRHGLPVVAIISIADLGALEEVEAA